MFHRAHPHRLQPLLHYEPAVALGAVIDWHDHGRNANVNVRAASGDVGWARTSKYEMREADERQDPKTQSYSYRHCSVSLSGLGRDDGRSLDIPAPNEPGEAGKGEPGRHADHVRCP